MIAWVWMLLIACSTTSAHAAEPETWMRVDKPSTLTFAGPNALETLNAALEPARVLARYRPSEVTVDKYETIQENGLAGFDSVITKHVLVFHRTQRIRGLMRKAPIFCPIKDSKPQPGFALEVDFAGSDGVVLWQAQRFRVEICTTPDGKGGLKATVKTLVKPGDGFGKGLIGGIVSDLIAAQNAPLVRAIQGQYAAELVAQAAAAKAEAEHLALARAAKAAATLNDDVRRPLRMMSSGLLQCRFGVGILRPSP